MKTGRCALQSTVGKPCLPCTLKLLCLKCSFLGEKKKELFEKFTAKLFSKKGLQQKRVRVVWEGKTVNTGSASCQMCRVGRAHTLSPTPSDSGHLPERTCHLITH